MTARAEELMRECRVKLGQAEMCERSGEIELADAYGAVAANKIAQAIRIDERAAVVVQMKEQA